MTAQREKRVARSRQTDQQRQMGSLSIPGDSGRPSSEGASFDCGWGNVRVLAVVHPVAAGQAERRCALVRLDRP